MEKEAKASDEKDEIIKNLRTALAKAEFMINAERQNAATSQRNLKASRVERAKLTDINVRLQAQCRRHSKHVTRIKRMAKEDREAIDHMRNMIDQLTVEVLRRDPLWIPSAQPWWHRWQHIILMLDKRRR